ncbi:MAG: ATP-dependent DNA helicase RecG [Candidatus Wildermuthbacteria bacterium]|nr:ATP-dependent DNA helicase RecG [Candidatus Wildermuthbacteria bacterium]
MSNPSYEKLSEPFDNITPSRLTHMGRLTPVYPETAGVSSKFLRSVIKTAIESLDASDKDTDAIPESIARAKGFPPFAQAIRQAHFPNTVKEAETAKNRFAFEELLLISLFIHSERKKIASVKAPAILFSAELMKKFTSALPFQLTSAQKKCACHILKDLEKPRPMNRLLQGDVGSGKTVVAAMAALSAVKAGYQAAFLSPTEILAKQHFKTVSELLRPFKLDVGLLTGKADRFISKKLPNEVIEISREKLLKKALRGDMPVLIGTHALIQETVRFGKLGLLIVDEQHRFGVKQRAKLLRGSALIPHLLSMTATPIPRTLAMTIYGDLDLSVIDELPKGRKPIITKLVPPDKRKETYDFIGQEVKKGRQVFVICPRIEPQNADMQFAGMKGKWNEAKAVKEEFEKLSKKVFPDLRVAMLHGKMASRDKEEVMKNFKRGKTDILVSTSVVEVGVDIPNASVMVIDGAEYFGLAQLHQFRGRVGRAEHQSYCFLFSAESSSRLRALEKTESGFNLPWHSLQIRRL